MKSKYLKNIKVHKCVINMANAYNDISYHYEFVDILDKFIKRQKQDSRQIIKIQVNDIDILPDLEQLRQVLLSMSKNQVINTKLLIEKLETI